MPKCILCLPPQSDEKIGRIPSTSGLSPSSTCCTVRACLITTLQASARLYLTIRGMRGRATSRGGADGSTWPRFDEQRCWKPCHLRTRAGSAEHLINRTRRAMACHHGPRGGVVEVFGGCAANTAGTVVANDVTEPPVRLKYAYDGRRPRGAPYRAPAYPGEGGEGRKHRESTRVSQLPPLYERIEGRSV